MRRISAIGVALLLLAVQFLTPWGPRVAHAATGDLVTVLNFDQQCSNGANNLGTGIAYVGQGYLYLTCWNSGNTPDLMRASSTTGHVDQTYDLAGGLGSDAYDATRNGLWTGWTNDTGQIYFIQLDAAKNVVSITPKFLAPQAVNGCNLDDGIAYDAATDYIYVSADCSTTVYVYKTDGTFVTSFPWSGNACYNSGLAIGGNLLFEGSDGCQHVWVVDKNTQAPAYDFDTSASGVRDEGLSCDTDTFAAQGKQVMWSKEAYSPNRAAAFEIAPGTCGNGGQPVNCAQTMPTFPSKSVTNGILDVKQQDGNGYLSNDYTGTTNMAAGYPNNNAFPGDTASFDNYFKKQNTGSSSTVVIKAKDQAGCTNQFDPLLTSTARDAGKPMTDTFSGILKGESQLQIVNGTPGLSHLMVTINGTSFKVDGLKDNEQRLLSIGAALHDGSNSMSVTSYGRPGGSAALIAGPPQS